jgi:hypothetical protein
MQFCTAYNVLIHKLYTDYKQTYDSINRTQMVEIMKEFGVQKSW